MGIPPVHPTLILKLCTSTRDESDVDNDDNEEEEEDHAILLSA